MQASSYERELRDIFRKHGFLVVRAGGSLGIDLLAVKGTHILPIEVKASRKRVHYTSDGSGRETEQLDRAAEMCRRAGLANFLVCYRLVGEKFHGAKSKEVYWKYYVWPEYAKRRKHYIFKWEAGVPLAILWCGLD